MTQQTRLSIVNTERLMERLMKLGTIGKHASGGVTRLALSEEDRIATELVEDFMREAGLSVRMDEAGNLIGRKEGRNPDAPIVMTGSHIDTVVEGGIFDGSLGVIGGIEALQMMTEQGIVTDHPLEVCVYRNEEGVRFVGGGYSGSSCLTGHFKSGRMHVTDKNGISVADALRASGVDPEKVGNAVRPKGSIKAHIELHIEQGKVLENYDHPVGVVTGICCASRMSVTITGEAGHAGTTPMFMRKDPLAAAGEIILTVEREAKKTGTAVGTIGQFEVLPGAANVIPGKVQFTIDIRDMNDAVLIQLLQVIQAQSEQICDERGVNLQFEVFGIGVPKPCSPRIQEIIKRSCSALELDIFSLPSGAGHDSGAFRDICEMGMIFVRSRGGISHNPAEWSSPEDCASGVGVLYNTLLELAVPVTYEGEK